MDLKVSLTCSHQLASFLYSKSHYRVHFLIPHAFSLSVYGSTVLLLDLGGFLSLLILYTVGRTPCTGDQAIAKPYLHTDIHALSGNRTYDPSVRASEDSSCLRPLGYNDRTALTLLNIKYRNISS
jgi:hypothetical protein